MFIFGRPFVICFWFLLYEINLLTCYTRATCRLCNWFESDSIWICKRLQWRLRHFLSSSLHSSILDQWLPGYLYTTGRLIFDTHLNIFREMKLIKLNIWKLLNCKLPWAHLSTRPGIVFAHSDTRSRLNTFKSSFWLWCLKLVETLKKNVIQITHEHSHFSVWHELIFTPSKWNAVF